MRPNRRALGAALLGGLAGLPRAGRAQATPFQFGVMPNVSTRILLTQYAPFRTFMEGELGQAVEIVTAPGLQAFAERAMQGAYGLAVMAANLGRVAQLDAGMRPVGIYEPRISCLLVAHRDRRPASLEALRGRNVAMTNPQSLVALRFTHWLRDQSGLVVSRDVAAQHARNEDSLAQFLTGPDTPLAVMSGVELNAIRPEIRNTLVIWREFETVPGFLLLIPGGTPAAEASRIEAALARFPRTDDGRRFFEATGFVNLRPVRPEEITELDTVVPETRRLLGRA